MKKREFKLIIERNSWSNDDHSILGVRFKNTTTVYYVFWKDDQRPNYLFYYHQDFTQYNKLKGL